MSDLVILEPHNEAQPGDELTTLTVNYLWRRHIVEALCRYFEPMLVRASENDDIQTTLNNFNALIVDLYDSEVLVANGAVVPKTSNQIIPAGYVYTKLTWDNPGSAFTFDDDNYFDNANERFKATTAGLYLFTCYAETVLANEQIILAIRVIPGLLIAQQGHDSAVQKGLAACSALVRLSVDDWVDAMVASNTQCNISIGRFSILRLGD